LRRAVLVGSGIGWLLAIAVGLIVLWDYDAGPAASGHPPGQWPRESRVPAPRVRPRLVIAAHPQCPCTRATIGELELLMARSNGLVDAYVLFYRPDGVPPGWERTDLWTRAAAIPGVHVVSDAHGAESARFGALASGQAMLYSTGGALLFRGGITASRGHSGDNAGRNAIVALLHQESPVQTVTPVFGCSLVNGAARRPRQPGALGMVEQVLARIGVPVQWVE
jgi:hypothetical protein